MQSYNVGRHLFEKNTKENKTIYLFIHSVRLRKRKGSNHYNNIEEAFRNKQAYTKEDSSFTMYSINLFFNFFSCKTRRVSEHITS